MSRKKEEIDSVLKTAEKSIKKKGILYGDDDSFKEEKLSTGFFVLDRILEGGLMRGVFYCIFGAYGQGKTTLGYSFIASIQKQCPDGQFALIDMEHRYSSDYAKRLGVDVSKLEVYRPITGEDALDLLKDFVVNKYDFVLVDSVAALSEKKIVESKMSQDTMGSKARMLSKFFEKAMPYNEHTIVLFLNQLRKNIGGVTNPGALKTMPGGEALKHYCRLIAEVTRSGWIPTKSTGEIKYDGFNIHIHILKSTVSTPQRFCDIPFNFAEGKTNEIAATIDLAILKKVISQSGPWYYFKDEKLMGKQSVITFFENNLEKYELLKDEITETNTPADKKIDIETAPVEVTDLGED